MSSARKLGESRLWKRIDAATRRASAAGSVFPDDTPEKKAERLEKGRHDPQFFCKTYLPHYFTGPSATFHGEWQEHVLDLSQPVKDKVRGAVIQCPRGSAKTTTISFGESLHLLAYGLVPFFCLVTDVLAQSEEIVGAIIEELQDNERLRSDFGDLVANASPTKWGEQVTTTHGCRLQALGMTSSFRGIKFGPHRPWMFLIDDPESDEGVRNPKTRQKRRDLMRRAIRKALKPGGSIVVIQNMIHADCLSAHVVNQVQEYRRRQADGEPTDANEYPFRRWVAFVYAIRNEDGESAWPEVFSDAYLQELEDEDPDGFAMEMMNIPVRDGAKVFDRSTFRMFEVEEMVGRDLLRIVSLDPSKGKNDRSDFSGIIAIAADLRNRICFVEHAELHRRNPMLLASDFVDMCELVRPAFGVVEDHAFQELLKDLIEAELEARGLNIPIRGYSDMTKKELRIERLARPVKTGVMRFKPEQTELMRQLNGFPDWPHDDGPDALEMAFSQVPFRTTRRGIWKAIRTGGSSLSGFFQSRLGFNTREGV